MYVHGHGKCVILSKIGQCKKRTMLLMCAALNLSGPDRACFICPFEGCMHEGGLCFPEENKEKRGK